MCVRKKVTSVVFPDLVSLNVAAALAQQARLVSHESKLPHLVEIPVITYYIIPPTFAS